MNICFECGGTVRLISKPGRLTWHDEELFEIPTEFKLATCIDCGHILEDPFIQTRLRKSVAGMKKSSPGSKLLMLRWIDTQIDNTLIRPSMYIHDGIALYEQIILLLVFRDVVISKGQVDKTNPYNRALDLLKKVFPKMGNTSEFLNKMSLEELSPRMREFCDLWIYAN